MKKTSIKTIIILLLIATSINLHSQSFNRIEKSENKDGISFKINKDIYLAKFGISSEARTPKLTISGKTNFIYKSNIQDAKLEFEIFSHPLSNKSYLLINNYKDYSHGAEVFIINKDGIKSIGHINVAAYKKSDNNIMDYCNILNHITILETTQKTYISFETPLIVINPGQHDEEINHGNKIYYTIESGKIIKNISE